MIAALIGAFDAGLIVGCLVCNHAWRRANRPTKTPRTARTPVPQPDPRRRHA